MAKKAPLDTSEPLPIPLGAGMFTAGDLATAPAGTSSLLENVFVRPGPELLKRPGFEWDGVTPNVPSRLVNYKNDTGVTYLIYGNNNSGYYRDTDGVAPHYTLPVVGSYGGATGGEIADYANFLSRVYTCAPSQPHCQTRIDGLVVTGNPYKAGITFESIASFKSRLYGAGTYEHSENLMLGDYASYLFESRWTLTGATVAVAAGLRTLTVNAATDSWKTTASQGTAATGGEWFRAIVQFRSRTSYVQPVTITLENAAGTTTYGTAPALVLPVTTTPDWQTYSVEGFAAGGGAVYVKVAAGTTTFAGVAGSFDVSFDDGVGFGHGAALSRGRYAYSQYIFGTGVPLSEIPTRFPSRLHWCEVNDPQTWRAGGYYDCMDVPGPLTTVRGGDGRLAAFKADAIWIFAPQDNANLPIALQRVIHDVGCTGPRAFGQYRGVAYFIGPDDVYRWDWNGDPQSLTGVAMKDTLFNATTVARPVLAIDTDNRELWCYTQVGRIYIFNLLTRAWSAITVSDADGAPLAVADLVYMLPGGEASKEMWASLSDGSGNIVRLRASATRDSFNGESSAITAKVRMRVLQTTLPQREFLIESIDIYHHITATQADSTTTAGVSFDGGTTFGRVNTVRVSPLASGDTVPMKIPLWQSHDRLMLEVTHTGDGGGTYFNITSAAAHLQVLGPRIQRQNPTPVGSTL